MILQAEIPTSVPPQIWQMEQILWWGGAIISVALGILFLIRMKKQQISKKFILGLAIFAFSYGFARIVENIRKYYVSTQYNDIVLAWASGSQIVGLNYILRIIYYIISWTGISTFYFVSEKYVFKHKYYYMTLASVLEGIVSILSYIPDSGPSNLTTFLAAVGFFIAGIFPIILYGKMAKVNTGSIRTSCALVTLGMFVFVFSVMTELPESTYITYLVGGIPLDVWITSILAPILFFISYTTLAIGFHKMFSDLT